ncbi:MAG: hypothetical protein OYG31_00720 [Candidatus Kaiserbacteria bacterium]|nr:hypothetical protein [Candidatus Kaiserbacteria bacterium]
MVIKSEDMDSGIKVEFTNGHLDKLHKITKEYGMKGAVHTIAFLLDVAEQSKGEGLSVGSKRYTPSDEMKYAKE